MFNNISNKIKILAKVICWVGIILFGVLGICFIVAGIVDGDGESIVYAIIYIATGIVLWVWSLLLYGFGQLIENTNSLNGVQVTQGEEEDEDEREKKTAAVMKDIAAWYLSNIDEDDERKKVIEEYIKKH